MSVRDFCLLSYLFFSLLVGLSLPPVGDEVDDDNEAVGMISAFNLQFSRVDPERKKSTSCGWEIIYNKACPVLHMTIDEHFELRPPRLDISNEWNLARQYHS